MDDRFKTLRLLSTVYKVVAWGGAGIGVIALLIAIWPTQQAVDIDTTKIGAGQAAVYVLAIALHFIVFLGFSQAIEVLFEILDRSLQSAKRSSEVAAVLGPMDVRLQNMEKLLEDDDEK